MKTYRHDKRTKAFFKRFFRQQGSGMKTFAQWQEDWFYISFIDAALLRRSEEMFYQSVRAIHYDTEMKLNPEILRQAMEATRNERL